MFIKYNIKFPFIVFWIHAIALFDYQWTMKYILSDHMASDNYK